MKCPRPGFKAVFSSLDTSKLARPRPVSARSSTGPTGRVPPVFETTGQEKRCGSNDVTLNQSGLSASQSAGYEFTAPWESVTGTRREHEGRPATVPRRSVSSFPGWMLFGGVDHQLCIEFPPLVAAWTHLLCNTPLPSALAAGQHVTYSMPPQKTVVQHLDPSHIFHSLAVNR